MASHRSHHLYRRKPVTDAHPRDTVDRDCNKQRRPRCRRAEQAIGLAGPEDEERERAEQRRTLQAVGRRSCVDDDRRARPKVRTVAASVTYHDGMKTLRCGVRGLTVIVTDPSSPRSRSVRCRATDPRVVPASVRSIREPSTVAPSGTPTTVRLPVDRFDSTTATGMTTSPRRRTAAPLHR